MSTPPVDGRRARGDARKLQIIEAALRVMAEHGSGAVTHRAVAKEASVPLASVTYHFDGIEDVIAATIAHANAQLAADLANPAWDTGVDGLAAFVARQCRDRRELILAEYEMYMTALRSPPLAETAMAWLDAVTDRFMPDLPAERTRAFHAMLEGVCLHSALRPDDYPAGEIERLLSTI